LVLDTKAFVYSSFFSFVYYTEQLRSLLLFENWVVGCHPIWELEEIEMGFAECSFVALATKDDNLITEMIVGHSEVVTSALADLVSGNETTLNYWNPDVIHDVEHNHVIEAVALCVKTAINEKIFWKGSIMCTNKNRLMAVPWRRLLSVHWYYLPHTLHSLHAYLYLSI